MKAIALRTMRRIAGGLLVLVGIALLFLPGPGLAVLFVGATLLGYGPQARALVLRIVHRFKRPAKGAPGSGSEPGTMLP